MKTLEGPDLERKAAEILSAAEECGVEESYYFLTTFRRYQVQLGILADLERALGEDDVLVTKEYVKGRANLYANPAVAEYNRTCDSANRTVATLLKIVGTRPPAEPDDPVAEFVRRGVRPPV